MVAWTRPDSVGSAETGKPASTSQPPSSVGRYLPNGGPAGCRPCSPTALITSPKAWPRKSPIPLCPTRARITAACCAGRCTRSISYPMRPPNRSRRAPATPEGPPPNASTSGQEAGAGLDGVAHVLLPVGGHDSRHGGDGEQLARTQPGEGQEEQQRDGHTRQHGGSEATRHPRGSPRHAVTVALSRW